MGSMPLITVFVLAVSHVVCVCACARFQLYLVVSIELFRFIPIDSNSQSILHE